MRGQLLGENLDLKRRFAPIPIALIRIAIVRVAAVRIGIGDLIIFGCHSVIRLGFNRGTASFIVSCDIRPRMAQLRILGIEVVGQRLVGDAIFVLVSKPECVAKPSGQLLQPFRLPFSANTFV